MIKLRVYWGAENYDGSLTSRERPQVVQDTLEATMAWREQGVSGLALPLRVYPVSQTEDAFRYMQNGTNVGKTVVEMKKDHQIMASGPSACAHHAHGRLTIIRHL